MASLITSSTLRLPKQIILSKSPSSQSKLFLRPPKPQSNPNLRLSASSLPPPPTLISDSTRPIASILATGLSIPKLLAQAIHGASSKIQDFCATPPQQDLAAIHQLQQSLAFSTAPLLFFANRGSLSTPLTVVASGMAKWLDIYSGVLLVRVLLSWFPNIPWDRQPLSAIRDLCDPYLNLFRNIIPPLFDTLDVSPLLAFAVLGTFSGILTHSRT